MLLDNLYKVLFIDIKVYVTVKLVRLLIYCLFLVLCFNTNLFYRNYFVKATIVSKCHHEGDFTIYCNKTRIPSSPDLVEVMRFAEVINGLYHNDTLCSYVPNTSCHRNTTLTHCVDKPYCFVKNGWYSLEPQCAGNSYYTQLDFDCQPAFYMCDPKTVISNVFSGLVYSPSYPNSFRSDRSDPCYLTIHLPKNHHAEITLDYFDMDKTVNCVGDYLEIQEYKEVTNPVQQNRRLSKRYMKPKNERYHSNKSYTSGVGSMNNLSNKEKSPIVKLNKLKANGEDAKLKSSRQHPQISRPKWSKLGTMCGRIESSITLRAYADTINFKFRSLAYNHPYLSANKNHSNKKNYGFKIYFQAIPPKAPMAYEHVEGTTKIVFPKRNSTASVMKEIEFTKIYEQPIDENSKNMKAFQTSIEKSTSYWSTIFVIIAIVIIVVIVIILLAVIAGFFICFIRKRRNNAKTSNFSKSNKDENLVKKGSISNDIKRVDSEKPKKKLNVADESDDSSRPKNSSSIKLESVASQPLPKQPTPTAATASTNKMKVVLEAEPRKMQAERPFLLQDLSQSKLLLKYKQEKLESCPNPTESAATNSKTEQVSKSPFNNPEQSSLEFKPQTSIKSATNSVQTTPKKTENKIIINNSKPTNGGIYDGDVYDGGGIYGAEMPTNIISKKSLNSSSPSPCDSFKANKSSPISKMIETTSKLIDDIKTLEVNEQATSSNNTSSNNNNNNNNNQELKTIAKNRKKSKDANEENENACLISKENKSENQCSLINKDNSNEFLKKDTHVEKSIISNEESSQSNELTEEKFDFINTKLEIIEEPFSKNSEKENPTVTFSLPPTTQTTSNTNHGILATTPRKPAFNPLHVILKDKNKYYTTEYI